MRGRSVLLALSGSQQSRYAAELCWAMSRQLGAQIVAQHVVDSHSAWEFIGHEKTGFLPSESYVTAYQVLCKHLFTLGEDLAAEYASQAVAQGCSPLCFVDEGNPVEQICNRALSHDLVVIGHKPGTIRGNNPHSQFLRLSIAEALAHECPRPLLVVQERTVPWQSLAILSSTEHINEQYINSCLDMASALCLQPLLLCLAGAPDINSDKFIGDLREANGKLASVPIAITEEVNEQLSADGILWNVAVPELEPDVTGSMLFVAPTREINKQRVTVLDSSPSVFVRYLLLSSILLWPEEYTFSFLEGPKKMTAAIRT